MIVGAHLLGRTLAKLIHRNGFDVLLIDTDPRNIAIARMDNLPVLEVDARDRITSYNVCYTKLLRYYVNQYILLTIYWTLFVYLYTNNAFLLFAIV